MEHATVTDGLGRVGLGAEGDRVIAAKALDPFRPDTMGRGHADDAAIDDEHYAPKGATHVDAAPGDCLEDWLDVGRGASDHPEDLTGRSLPVQRAAHLRMRLCQRAILLLHLLKQPRVLDGDHRLVGEGLQQIGLTFTERLYLGPRYHDYANRSAVLQKRHAEHAATAISYL